MTAVSEGEITPDEAGALTTAIFPPTSPNAFEAFASSVDILAYLNNLKAGRRFN